MLRLTANRPLRDGASPNNAGTTGQGGQPADGDGSRAAARRYWRSGGLGECGDLAHDLKSQVSYGRKDRGGMHEV